MTRRWLIAAPMLLLVPFAAKAQTRAGADVAIKGGYSNNPFLTVGPNTAAASVSVDVAPYIERISERSTFSATLSAHVEQYLARYSTVDNYSGSFAYKGTPSERISTFAKVDLATQVVGNFNSASIDVSQIPNNDIGLLGTRDRRRSIYATGGFSARISQYDTLSGSVTADFARYSRFGLRGNFNGYTGTAGYSRTLSSRSSIGLRGTLSRYEYTGARGTTDVYSVQATGSTRLNKYWTVEGSAGVTFINNDVIGSTNQTSLSGDISLCRQAKLTSLCVTGSRTARATGFNGSQYITTIGANWTRKLNEFSDIGLTARYTNNGGIQSVIPSQREYFFTSVTYDRRLKERLNLTVSTRYRTVSGGVIRPSGDYGGQVGLSYQFGRPK